LKVLILNHMALDWAKIYKKYKGLWVVLDEKERRVVAFDRNAKKAFEKAQKKGVKIPILFKVPSKTISYIGVHLLI
jgi:hypothetical protein